MADITDQQFLSQDPEILGLQRQRQLANLLTGQASITIPLTPLKEQA